MPPLSDEALITAQMGRRPHGVVAVAARCPAGHPAVVTCHPLRRRSARVAPFPTLYWLTCPTLCTAVAHLERDGAIAAVEAELARDADLRAQLGRNHDGYIARRWALLDPAERVLASERGLAAGLLTRGIGGMANRAAVKCLHLHLAHHLAEGNAIGSLVLKKYGLRPCAARDSD